MTGLVKVTGQSSTWTWHCRVCGCDSPGTSSLSAASDSARAHLAAHPDEVIDFWPRWGADQRARREARFLAWCEEEDRLGDDVDFSHGWQ